jgi:hypothetical protein
MERLMVTTITNAGVPFVAKQKVLELQKVAIMDGTAKNNMGS